VEMTVVMIVEMAAEMMDEGNSGDDEEMAQ
jgi:hypothetical protein